MGSEITIEGADGKFMAYRAAPASGTGPGLVLIQEIFGVNPNMRSIADSLAGAGFTVYVPDLFWRFEPGIQLDPAQQADFDRAIGLYQKYNEDDGVTDIETAATWLREDEANSTGKVGCQGYCLGGKLAYLMACRSDLEANVGYYGVGIQNALDEAKTMASPLLLHVAEEDGFVPKEAQAAMHKGLDGNPKVTIHDYAGCDHGFAREGGHAWNAAAAKQANDRSIAFLKDHLS
jgi:carboxymethylenebutenolidase